MMRRLFKVDHPLSPTNSTVLRKLFNQYDIKTMEELKTVLEISHKTTKLDDSSDFNPRLWYNF